MDGLKVNRFGRTYHTGVALDQDMRTLIIDGILQEGGDRVTVNTITKIWRQFCEEFSITCNSQAKGGARWSKLSEDGEYM